MTAQTLDTLYELHEIRERIAQEQARLSARDRVERTHHDADMLLTAWGLTLRQALPSSTTASR